MIEVLTFLEQKLFFGQTPFLPSADILPQNQRAGECDGIFLKCIWGSLFLQQVGGYLVVVVTTRINILARSFGCAPSRRAVPDFN